MKTALLLVGLTALSAVSAQSPAILPKNETNMNDFQFFTQIFYNTYNGFVRGFYKEHQHTVISKECLGDWVGKNLTQLEKVFNQVIDMEILDITYEDALEAAKDVVFLIFRNREFCQVDKILGDLERICASGFDDVDVWTNLKANVFPIFSKVEKVVEFLFKADQMDDSDIIDMCDQLGESYGAIMAYIIGFDERFNVAKKLI